MGRGGQGPCYLPLSFVSLPCSLLSSLDGGQGGWEIGSYQEDTPTLWEDKEKRLENHPFVPMCCREGVNKSLQKDPWSQEKHDTNNPLILTATQPMFSIDSKRLKQPFSSFILQIIISNARMSQHMPSNSYSASAELNLASSGHPVYCSDL